MSKGGKAARIIGGILLMATQAALNAQIYQNSGISNFYPLNTDFMFQSPPSVYMYSKPEGKYAYAYCSETGALNIIDMQAQKRILSHPVSFSSQYPLHVLPGSTILVVRSHAMVEFIDTATNRPIVQEWPSDEIRDFVLSPDGKTLWAICGDKLVGVNTTTGKKQREMKDLGDLTAIVFAVEERSGAES